MIIEVSNKGLPQGQSCSHAEVGYVGHKSHTSGEFRSRLNLFRFGRYESSMKAPSVQPGNTRVNGNYISTMFAYRDAKFKHWSEIDVEVTGDKPNAVTANVLKADHTGSWSPGIQDSAHMFPKGFDSRTRFNTYAFEWLPNKITWYVNDKIVRIHKGGRVPVPQLSTKIMMNLWVFNGGGFGGSQVGNNHYPMHNEYDWFRFYKWDGDKQYPCPTMDRACLTQDDMYLTSNNPCDGVKQEGLLWGRKACTAQCTKYHDLRGDSAAAHDVQEFAETSQSAAGVPATAASAQEPHLEPVEPLEDVMGGSCDVYGCSEYDASHSCQCNSKCSEHGNCCSDYATKCGSGAAPAPAPSVNQVQAGNLPYGHPSATKDYPKYDGFTLWLVEEFDEPLDLDTDPIWTYSDGGLSEGIVRFVKDAIKFKDGKMMIEVSNKGLPQGHSCSHAEVGYVGRKSHTSGELRTRLNLFRYGRYEVRMKAPSVQPGNTHVDGNYISTMFAYRDAKFKHWSEIDVEVTGDRANAVTANVLKADGRSTWSPGIQDSAHMFPRGFDSRSKFNTYAFEWLPTKITWFINGKVVREHRGGRVPIPTLSTKIMMNLWVFNGGGFGGHQVYNNRYPMHNEYDWFRFYKWDEDKHYPCKAMDQSCLTEDDMYLTGNNPCDNVPQKGLLYGRKACTAPCSRHLSDVDAQYGSVAAPTAWEFTPKQVEPSVDQVPATAASPWEPTLEPLEPAEDVKAESCAVYGCNDQIVESQGCQCTAKCAELKNCCEDYEPTCVSPPAAPVVATAQLESGSLPYGHPSKSKEYPKHLGFTLWLVEEFDEPLNLDTDPIWTYSDGGLSEGKVRFVKDAIQFRDGKMIIEVSQKGLPQGQSCSHAEVGYVDHKSHTSGEFRSRLNLFRYGRYEVSMKAPTVQPGNANVNGNYISTMFAYRDAKFKHWSEIDVEVTGDRPNAVTANVLKADGTGSWTPGIQDSRHMFPRNFNARAKFNTYAFEWLPDRITWFVNDEVVRVHKGGRVPIPGLSTKIMMNLWVFNGGGFGGPQVGNNRYPMHNEYDWFRFYKWDKDSKYPCAAMDESCLTEDDMYLTSNNPCDGVKQKGKLWGRSPCIASCKKQMDLMDTRFPTANASTPVASDLAASDGQEENGLDEEQPSCASSSGEPNLDAPAADAGAGSCEAYGCNNGYQKQHSCQCTPECGHYQNCCGDYKAACKAEAAAPPALQPAPSAAKLPFGHPSATVDYPKHKGFTLWLVEEFDEPLDLSTDPIWTYSDGGLSEGKVRFVKDAITFKDGKMRIEVSNKGLPQGQSCSHAEVGYVGHKSHTSGELRTRLNLFRYGRYEVSMKAPSVRPGDTHTNGNYISTMFAYRDAKFKHWSEIDIEVTGDRSNAVTSNVLKADGVSSWSPGIQATQQFFLKDFNSREQFHTYAFEWLPKKITWFIDGEVRRQHTGGRVPVPSLSTKIMMNLWVFNGGGFGGHQVYNNHYPMHNEYDWFRFYKWDGDDKYPCAAMDKSCLTEDDMYLTSNNPCDGIEQLGSLHGRRACTAKCLK
eukprot:TRINITY_DN58_c0_g1_i1.p1 TRINITY_DN58_c0_g1~~TRINITY_DN58_c0_g1_i1.p1  ORF type:complete len:1537 (-),score=346.89 TRINITY_DN58_c0_g1_i1:167-4777(-)